MSDHDDVFLCKNVRDPVLCTKGLYALQGFVFTLQGLQVELCNTKSPKSSAKKLVAHGVVDVQVKKQNVVVRLASVVGSGPDSAQVASGVEFHFLFSKFKKGRTSNNTCDSHVTQSYQFYNVPSLSCCDHPSIRQCSHWLVHRRRPPQGTQISVEETTNCPRYPTLDHDTSHL